MILPNTIITVFFIVSAALNGVLFSLTVRLVMERRQRARDALNVKEFAESTIVGPENIIQILQQMKNLEKNRMPVTVSTLNIEEIFRSMGPNQVDRIVKKTPVPIFKITNYQFNLSIPMMLLKMDPSFENDPDFTNPFVNPEIFKHASNIAAQMDEFIRKAIGKIFSESSLSLFIDTSAAIPGMDVEMMFFSPSKCKVSVLFQNRLIGRATFDSHLEQGETGAKLISKITEENV